MKTKEMPLSPSLLLEMDEARLHALKAAMEGFIREFKKLVGMMDQDLEATGNLKRKVQKMEARDEEREGREESPEKFIFCHVHRRPERGHCNCHGRKGRGRRHDG